MTKAFNDLANPRERTALQADEPLGTQVAEAILECSYLCCCTKPDIRMQSPRHLLKLFSCRQGAVHIRAPSR